MLSRHTGVIVEPSPPAAHRQPAPPPRARAAGRLLARSKLWLGLWLLMLPTVASLVVFGYYPKVDVIIKAFYRWEPGRIDEYTGLTNFTDAISDPLFWQSFKLVAILLTANLFKMWPSIITAVALHRLASQRWRYIFQICFVIPMVIPPLVWLLIWKSFFEPDFGMLNRLLKAGGVMPALHFLDGSPGAPGLMPRLAAALAPILDGPIAMIFGNVWGMVLLGALVLTIAMQYEHSARRWPTFAAIASLALLMPAGIFLGAFTSLLGLAVFVAAAIALLVALQRQLPGRWVAWPFWMLAAFWVFFDQPWRFPVAAVIAIAATELAHRWLPRLDAQDVLRWFGVALITLGGALVLLGMIWIRPTGQFEYGAPAWLGNRDLIIPAVIFWGFPWVGTVGVLIYLAGLQQISNDVYEAAELDGVGPIGRLFRIELPLIMTQVRINLIFMTIGTLTAYEFFLILLGPSGGPGNRGMVPGLYMYRQAFIDGRFGYACALGMVLFVMILLLTIVYQRYVKVEK